jgi:hypothetical protein
LVFITNKFMIGGCSGSVLHKIADVDITTYEFETFILNCLLLKFYSLPRLIFKLCILFPFYCPLSNIKLLKITVVFQVLCSSLVTDSIKVLGT